MIFEKELVEKIRSAFPRAVTDFNGRKRAFFANGTATLVVDRAAKAENEKIKTDIATAKDVLVSLSLATMENYMFPLWKEIV